MNVFGDNPVLPKEAQSLPTHVEQCAKRYSELAKVVRKLQTMVWLFQVYMLPATVWIICKLQRWI